MSSLLITLLLLVGASLQTLLPPVVWAGSMEWPIVSGLLVYITFRTDRPRVIYAALLAGVLYDSFSPAPMGTSLPFFLLMGLGLFKVREEVFSDQIVTYFVLGLIVVFLKSIYFCAVLPLSGLRPPQWGFLSLRLFGGLLLGTLTAPAVYFVLSWLRRALPEPRRRAR